MSKKAEGKKIKRGIALMLGFTMLFGTVTAQAANKAWREWRYPSDYGKVSEDRTWRDDSWKADKQIKFNCDGMEYYCMATMGFEDGTFSNKDYIKGVGGVSVGMKCGGRVYNSKGSEAVTGWIYDGKLSGKASVENTGTNVKFKFTVATKGY